MIESNETEYLNNKAMVGKFFSEVMSRIRKGDDAPPFVLYSSQALSLMGAMGDLKNSDIDVITSSQGLRTIEDLLLSENELKKLFNVKELSVEKFSTLDGSQLLNRLRCAMMIEGIPVNLDLWDGIDPKGYFLGIGEKINIKENTNQIPVEFNKNLVLEHVDVPTLNLETIGKIYKILHERRQKNDIKVSSDDPHKNRYEKVEKAFSLRSINFTPIRAVASSSKNA